MMVANQFCSHLSIIWSQPINCSHLSIVWSQSINCSHLSIIWSQPINCSHLSIVWSQSIICSHLSILWWWPTSFVVICQLFEVNQLVVVIQFCSHLSIIWSQSISCSHPVFCSHLSIFFFVVNQFVKSICSHTCQGSLRSIINNQ